MREGKRKRGDSMTRDEFMDVVYDELHSDGDNNRANRIIDAADSYAQPEPAQWVQMLINRHMYKCSNCLVAWNKRLVFDDDGYSKNIFMKYCPCCGKKMEGVVTE